MPARRRSPCWYWSCAMPLDGPARFTAAQALGRLGPEARAAVPALIDALGSTRETSRIQAALALWKIDRRADKALPALMRHSRDRKSSDPASPSPARRPCSVVGDDDPEVFRVGPPTPGLPSSDFELSRRRIATSIPSST